MQSSRVTLTFSDGECISNFISFELRESFTDPLTRFTFEVAPPPERFAEYRKRLKKSEIVGFLVDDKPQFAGIIWAAETNLDTRDGATIQVEAFCALKLIYQSTIDFAAVSKILQADGPLIDLVSEVFAPYEIGVSADSDIALLKSRTGRNPKATATPTKELKFKEAQGQPNETAMSFVNRILTRQGVMLRMDSAAILAYITAPHYDGDPLYTVKLCPSGEGPEGDRFFGRVTESDSNEGQYTFVETMGSASDDVSETQANTPRARVNSRDINYDRPPFRITQTVKHVPCYHRDTSCRDNAQAERVSKLVLGIKAEDAYQISGNVHGLVSRNGTPWTVDTLCRVFIPKLGIDEVMWISERTLRGNATSGQSTSLTLLPKGYVTLGDIPS
jgi:hypothetical protein